MGTPELARVILRALAGAPELEVVLVVAQPDKPVGRGLGLRPPPVKDEALTRGIPVLQPVSARDPEFLEAVRASAPDVAVVAAFGQILPPALLAVPRRGCLNVHTSILPRWRGAAPISWAILSGDRETGVTLMRMDAGLDTGDIVALERTPIDDGDTGRTLHDRLADLGAGLLLRALPDWLAGRLSPRPQPAEGVTYARKLTKDDGRLRWSDPAGALWRRVRALDPWPGAFTTMREGGASPVLLRVWRARPVSGGGGSPGEVLRAEGDDLVVAAGEGALRLEEVQREGRRRLPAREFLRGTRLSRGVRLGDAGESSGEGNTGGELPA